MQLLDESLFPGLAEGTKQICDISNILYTRLVSPGWLENPKDLYKWENDGYPTVFYFNTTRKSRTSRTTNMTGACQRQEMIHSKRRSPLRGCQ